MPESGMMARIKTAIANDRAESQQLAADSDRRDQQRLQAARDVYNRGVSWVRQKMSRGKGKRSSSR
jgi:hypothetical protein